MIVRAQIELPLDPAEAFRTVLEELAAAGVTVEATEPCRQISFEWRPAPWEQTVTGVELRFVPAGNGTLVTIEHHGFEALLGDGRELAGWFAGQLVAPLLGEGLGDWLTDRRARRPSGAAAREVYRDPLYHRSGFKVLLGMLDLGRDDVLLEVGCGGGALLDEALESGCSTLAVDHSAEMVGVAREQNREAVAAGRLKVIQATAVALPFADGAATAAVMTGVLGFLTDPVVVLREIRARAAGWGPARSRGQRSRVARHTGGARAHGGSPAFLRRRGRGRRACRRSTYRCSPAGARASCSLAASEPGPVNPAAASPGSGSRAGRVRA